MPKNIKGNNQGRTAGVVGLALVGLALVIAMLLQGKNVALFNPKGQIAQEQLDLMILSVGIMLIIAIPTVFFLYFTAWKYRESNNKVTRDPHVGHGKLLNISMWLVPSAFMVVLAIIMIPATHKLEPKKQIAADAKPLTIQVVALRWKWLFIYPEQKIASVNFVQVPTGTPVTFELTADETPMSAFWIPNLGGMLYAMNGHTNQLNLIANTPGDYPGSTAEVNGAGYSGMKFTARASSREDFDQWANGVQQFNNVLDTKEYDKLLKPSENAPVVFYSAADTDLYDKILMKYSRGGHGHKPAQYEGGH